VNQVCQICCSLLSAAVQATPRLNSDESNAIDCSNLRQHIVEQPLVIVPQGKVDIQIVRGWVPTSCLAVIGNDRILVEVQGHTNKSPISWGKVWRALPWDADWGGGGDWTGARSGDG